MPSHTPEYPTFASLVINISTIGKDIKELKEMAKKTETELASLSLFCMQVLTGKAVAPQPEVGTTRVTEAGYAARPPTQCDPRKTYANTLNQRIQRAVNKAGLAPKPEQEEQLKKGHQGPGNSDQIDSIHLAPSLKITLIKLTNLLVKKHHLLLKLEKLTRKLDHKN